MWAHVFFTRSGLSPFPSKDNYDSNSFSSVIELVKFRRKKVQKVFKSLIKSSFSSETPNEINNDNNGPKESAISESYDEDIVSDDISQHYLSHLGTKLSGSDITKTADDDQPIVGF